MRFKIYNKFIVYNVCSRQNSFNKNYSTLLYTSARFATKNLNLPVSTQLDATQCILLLPSSATSSNHPTKFRPGRCFSDESQNLDKISGSGYSKHANAFRFSDKRITISYTIPSCFKHFVCIRNYTSYFRKQLTRKTSSYLKFLKKTFSTATPSLIKNPDQFVMPSTGSPLYRFYKKSKKRQKPLQDRVNSYDELKKDAKKSKLMGPHRGCYINVLDKKPQLEDFFSPAERETYDHSRDLEEMKNSPLNSIEMDLSTVPTEEIERVRSKYMDKLLARTQKEMGTDEIEEDDHAEEAGDENIYALEKDEKEEGEVEEANRQEPYVLGGSQILVDHLKGRNMYHYVVPENMDENEFREYIEKEKKDEANKNSYSLGSASYLIHKIQEKQLNDAEDQNKRIVAPKDFEADLSDFEAKLKFKKAAQKVKQMRQRDNTIIEVQRRANRDDLRTSQASTRPMQIFTREHGKYFSNRVGHSPNLIEYIRNEMRKREQKKKRKDQMNESAKEVQKPIEGINAKGAQKSEGAQEESDDNKNKVMMTVPMNKQEVDSAESVSTAVVDESFESDESLLEDDAPLLTYNRQTGRHEYQQVEEEWDLSPTQKFEGRSQDTEGIEDTDEVVLYQRSSDADLAEYDLDSKASTLGFSKSEEFDEDLEEIEEPLPKGLENIPADEKDFQMPEDYEYPLMETNETGVPVTKDNKITERVPSTNVNTKNVTPSTLKTSQEVEATLKKMEQGTKIKLNESKEDDLTLRRPYEHQTDISLLRPWKNYESKLPEELRNIIEKSRKPEFELEVPPKENVKQRDVEEKRRKDITPDDPNKMMDVMSFPHEEKFAKEYPKAEAALKNLNEDQILKSSEIEMDEITQEKVPLDEADRNMLTMIDRFKVYQDKLSKTLPKSEPVEKKKRSEEDDESNKDSNPLLLRNGREQKLIMLPNKTSLFEESTAAKIVKERKAIKMNQQLIKVPNMILDDDYTEFDVDFVNLDVQKTDPELKAQIAETKARLEYRMLVKQNIEKILKRKNQNELPLSQPKPITVSPYVNRKELKTKVVENRIVMPKLVYKIADKTEKMSRDSFLMKSTKPSKAKHEIADKSETRPRPVLLQVKPPTVFEAQSRSYEGNVPVKNIKLQHLNGMRTTKGVLNAALEYKMFNMKTPGMFAVKKNAKSFSVSASDFKKHTQSDDSNRDEEKKPYVLGKSTDLINVIKKRDVDSDVKPIIKDFESQDMKNKTRGVELAFGSAREMDKAGNKTNLTVDKMSGVRTKVQSCAKSTSVHSGGKPLQMQQPESECENQECVCCCYEDVEPCDEEQSECPHEAQWPPIPVNICCPEEPICPPECSIPPSSILDTIEPLQLGEYKPELFDTDSTPVDCSWCAYPKPFPPDPPDCARFPPLPPVELCICRCIEGPPCSEPPPSILDTIKPLQLKDSGLKSTINTKIDCSLCSRPQNFPPDPPKGAPSRFPPLPPDMPQICVCDCTIPPFACENPPPSILSSVKRPKLRPFDPEKACTMHTKIDCSPCAFPKEFPPEPPIGYPKRFPPVPPQTIPCCNPQCINALPCVEPPPSILNTIDPLKLKPFDPNSAPTEHSPIDCRKCARPQRFPPEPPGGYPSIFPPLPPNDYECQPECIVPPPYPTPPPSILDSLEQYTLKEFDPKDACTKNTRIDCSMCARPQKFPPESPYAKKFPPLPLEEYICECVCLEPPPCPPPPPSILPNSDLTYTIPEGKKWPESDTKIDCSPCAFPQPFPPDPPEGVDRRFPPLPPPSIRCCCVDPPPYPPPPPSILEGQCQPVLQETFECPDLCTPVDCNPRCMSQRFPPAPPCDETGSECIMSSGDRCEGDTSLARRYQPATLVIVKDGDCDPCPKECDQCSDQLQYAQGDPCQKASCQYSEMSAPVPEVNDCPACSSAPMQEENDVANQRDDTTEGLEREESDEEAMECQDQDAGCHSDSKSSPSKRSYHSYHCDSVIGGNGTDCAFRPSPNIPSYTVGLVEVDPKSIETPKAERVPVIERDPGSVVPIREPTKNEDQRMESLEGEKGYQMLNKRGGNESIHGNKPGPSVTTVSSKDPVYITKLPISNQGRIEDMAEARDDFLEEFEEAIQKIEKTVNVGNVVQQDSNHEVNIVHIPTHKPLSKIQIEQEEYEEEEETQRVPVLRSRVSENKEPPGRIIYPVKRDAESDIKVEDDFEDRISDFSEEYEPPENAVVVYPAIKYIKNENVAYEHEIEDEDDAANYKMPTLSSYGQQCNKNSEARRKGMQESAQKTKRSLEYEQNLTHFKRGLCTCAKYMVNAGKQGISSAFGAINNFRIMTDLKLLKSQLAETNLGAGTKCNSKKTVGHPKAKSVQQLRGDVTQTTREGKIVKSFNGSSRIRTVCRPESQLSVSRNIMKSKSYNGPIKGNVTRTKLVTPKKIELSANKVEKSAKGNRKDAPKKVNLTIPSMLTAFAKTITDKNVATTPSNVTITKCKHVISDIKLAKKAARQWIYGKKAASNKPKPSPSTLTISKYKNVPEELKSSKSRKILSGRKATLKQTTTPGNKVDRPKPSGSLLRTTSRRTVAHKTQNIKRATAATSRTNNCISRSNDTRKNVKSTKSRKLMAAEHETPKQRMAYIGKEPNPNSKNVSKYTSASNSIPIGSDEAKTVRPERRKKSLSRASKKSDMAPKKSTSANASKELLERNKLYRTVGKAGYSSAALQRISEKSSMSTVDDFRTGGRPKRCGHKQKASGDESGCEDERSHCEEDQKKASKCCKRVCCNIRSQFNVTKESVAQQLAFAQQQAEQCQACAEPCSPPPCCQATAEPCPPMPPCCQATAEPCQPMPCCQSQSATYQESGDSGQNQATTAPTCSQSAQNTCDRTGKKQRKWLKCASELAASKSKSKPNKCQMEAEHAALPCRDMAKQREEVERYDDAVCELAEERSNREHRRMEARAFSHANEEHRDDLEMSEVCCRSTDDDDDFLDARDELPDLDCLDDPVEVVVPPKKPKNLAKFKHSNHKEWEARKIVMCDQSEVCEDECKKNPIRPPYLKPMTVEEGMMQLSQGIKKSINIAKPKPKPDISCDDLSQHAEFLEPPIQEKIKYLRQSKSRSEFQKKRTYFKQYKARSARVGDKKEKCEAMKDIVKQAVQSTKGRRRK